MADIIFPGEATSGTLGTTRLPDNLDLVIWQGDTQEYYINLTDDATPAVPIDLTGCTAQAVIRSSFTSPTSYDFTCTITDAVGGVIKLYMTAANCALIPAGDYVWNFQITLSTGEIRTYLAGDVLVYAEVD
jgi:hypothetical protein